MARTLAEQICTRFMDSIVAQDANSFLVVRLGAIGPEGLDISHADSVEEAVPDGRKRS